MTRMSIQTWSHQINVMEGMSERGLRGNSSWKCVTHPTVSQGSATDMRVITELCLDLEQRKWAGSDGKLWLMVWAFVRDCDTVHHVSDCSYELFCSSMWNVMLWTAFLLGSQVSVSEGAAEHTRSTEAYMPLCGWTFAWCDAAWCGRPCARHTLTDITVSSCLCHALFSS